MKNIISILKNQLKISTKFPLIVSVSGGSDSMALLSMMIDGPYKLAVVHFNHMKREESVIEADLVETYCKEHDVPFHYYTIEVGEGNFHHQAHELRKHYLIEVAHLYKTPYILTAHHLDDLFENILIKMTRGSNLLGYAGMQLMHSDGHFTYIKPLLYTSKEDILTYVDKHSIPFLDDASNEENFYLRNRFRHAVVPIMKQENENLLEQIKQYHHQISSAFHYIRKTTASLIKEDMSIPIDLYKTWDETIQDDAIAYLIEDYDLSLSFEIVQKIKKMILSNRPNQTYRLSKNCEFVKSYNKASIKTYKPISKVKYELKEGENKLENMAIFTLLYKSNAITEEFSKLCYNKLAFPLRLRHREDGDLLTYDYGHKKLKKLLIDLKISNEDRNNLWVLTDSDNQILWVQNHYVNQTLGQEKEIYFKVKEVKPNAQ
ncbi:MAG: tRNA lysidine(34) synthetase TilS [Tenericutes bacterium GWE2_38_8]|nr:MAG: tRNA lysidine(34) synthetase TilS [Tenericutes bacterium GWE2_38_8]